MTSRQTIILLMCLGQLFSPSVSAETPSPLHMVVGQEEVLDRGQVVTCNLPNSENPLEYFNRARNGDLGQCTVSCSFVNRTGFGFGKDCLEWKVNARGETVATIEKEYSDLDSAVEYYQQKVKVSAALKELFSQNQCFD